MENMKGKNLIQEEKETVKEEVTPSSPQSMESFLEKMGVDWEKKGRAYYIYPSSLDQVKEITRKIPSPTQNEYAIIPLGSTSGYTVFIMVTGNGMSVRIGYGRNSIPFLSSLPAIIEKLEKVTKEIGIENRKNSKNLLGV